MSPSNKRHSPGERMMKTVWRYLTRKPPTTDPLDEIQKGIRALEIRLDLFTATYGSGAPPLNLGIGKPAQEAHGKALQLIGGTR